MSRRCQVRGTKPEFGNNVSHSQRHTKRRWNPNTQKKRYWVPSLGRKVTLTLTPQSNQGDRSPRRRYCRRRDAHTRRENLMAKKTTQLRPIIKLRSTAGTGYTYVTRKNRRNTPDRLVLKKFDPIVRRHVEFKEAR